MAKRRNRDPNRVTWRRVSHPFAGYSGFGPLGLAELVYVRVRDDELVEFGWSRGGLLEAIGTRGNVTAAKEAAESLFRKEASNG